MNSYFTYLIGLILIAVLGILIYTLVPGKNGSQIEQGICGNESIPTTYIHANGKKLFRNYCAACHAKDMTTTATGPALQNSLARWESDTTQLTGYLNNSTLFETEPRIKKLRQELNFTGTSHKNQFSKKEVVDIIHYIQSIDLIAY